MAIEGYQKVIFHEQSEISPTCARWLVTFAIDLAPYDAAFQSLDECIRSVQTGAKEDFPQEFLGDVTFETLVKNANDEFMEVKKEREHLLSKYDDYRSMAHRSRRLLPIVGNALSYLFGVTSEDDLCIISRELARLTNTQGRLLHVMEDSISVINVTRHAVSDNRRKINKFIVNLRGIVVSMANVTQGLDKRVAKLEVLTHRYWLYKIMVEGLRKYLSDVHMALSYLELQLNLLSIGHLSPSIIALHDLRKILHSIAWALLDNFKLANDPDTGIWHYYEMLGCSTLFGAESIVIVVDMPLLDREHFYVVYNILNFPLPLPVRPGSVKGSRLSAKFKLDLEMIAVNKAGTRYILLSRTEAVQCSASKSKPCEVSGPVYVTKARESCEMSLFRRSPAEIERNCQVTIMTNTRLPVALRLDQRSWIVATMVDLHFVILCGDRTCSKLVARAPLATVRMNSGCTAYSDFMVLVAQVNGSSSFGNVGPLQIRPINVSSPIVWSPITKKFPNFSVDAIPGKLREMEEIPIQKLLNALEQVEVERFRERPKGV